MRKTFAHHAPSAAAVEKIARLRKAFSELNDLVEDAFANPRAMPREYAIAARKLEEAAMWAIKGIVLSDPDSKVSQS